MALAVGEDELHGQRAVQQGSCVRLVRAEKREGPRASANPSVLARCLCSGSCQSARSAGAPTDARDRDHHALRFRRPTRRHRLRRAFLPGAMLYRASRLRRCAPRTLGWACRVGRDSRRSPLRPVLLDGRVDRTGDRLLRRCSSLFGNGLRPAWPPLRRTRAQVRQPDRDRTDLGGLEKIAPSALTTAARSPHARTTAARSPYARATSESMAFAVLELGRAWSPRRLSSRFPRCRSPTTT
jgi:hypothetical protein